ncbi:ATP-binding cassette domain-containing protein, partial [Paenibacillus polymyxa]
MEDQTALGGKDTIEQVAGRKPLLHVEHLEICRTGVGASESGSKPLLRDVSFSIYSGEIVALTGPSGCGKSLTAHAIAGMLEPGIDVTQGRIYYN